MIEYKVEIHIDIDAYSPREAAELAWEYLTKEMPHLPSCFVYDGSGNIISVDLEDPDDKGDRVLCT